MSVFNKNILIFLGSAISFISWINFASPSSGPAMANMAFLKLESPPDDTIIKGKRVSKRRTTGGSDRHGDPYSNRSSRSPLLLGNPSNIRTVVEVDSSHQNYSIQEKVGEVDYRPPSTMTFEEYQKHKNQEMLQNYWRSKAAGPLGEREDTKKEGVKSLKIPVRGLEGPFGSNFVDIKPNGAVTLDFGARWQRVNNPIIPVRSQRNGGFEFDQQISMNVVGKIGEKLKLTANWDTKATFEFQNNIKLEYTGFEEDIIQKIEAGYVSMPINSTLISGAQNLFGIKTKLQFGRLSVTSVLSSQRGKVEEVRMQGGSQTRDFEIRVSQYDENRHFFLGQFFRNNYERALQNLPVIASGVNITKVNVYVTNRINNTNTNKNIIAYLDLGEAQPSRPFLAISNFQNNAGAAANDSFNLLRDKVRGMNVFDYSSAMRDPSTVVNEINSRAIQVSNGCTDCFVSGTDYTIITSARQLSSTEFTYNHQLGFISLNTPVTAQDFLAVSYEYTYTDPRTGRVTVNKVGEVVGDKTADSSRQLLVLKMLKPIGTRTNLPTWNLMMKNVYQLGATQIARENFILRVIYKDDSTGMDTPFLQMQGERKSLLGLLNMDRLNPNNDPPADGNFDFIEGVTIDSKYGRVIFPRLEPFGQGLGSALPNEELKTKYVFDELYRQQLADVSRITERNKFFLKGRYQSSSTSDIMLPGLNIAPGSVTVLAGSNPLMEGVDYTVDYSMGRVKIKNEGILASGQEIRIKYEKQDLFNFRRKTFFGNRFDYKISNEINIGATVLHQTEAPQITRTNIGDEPSSNTIWGVDANIKKESRLLTKIIDRLPLIQTKAPSSITFAGEFAQLVPGHPKVIDKSEGGTSFIDDFDGAETPYILTSPANRWRIGSMPLIRNDKLTLGQRTDLLREFNSTGLDNAFHRAKLSWYIIDGTTFYRNKLPGKMTKENIENRFVQPFAPNDVFPNYRLRQGDVQLQTLDLAYFPAERGPYNYNVNELNSDGLLQNPKMSWGAITRDLKNDIDFDNANIQYIEFWMMNPYFSKYSQRSTGTFKDQIPLLTKEQNEAEPDPSKRNKNVDPVKGAGKLYFNLGEISEDIMRDNQHFFENGLPTGGESGPSAARETPWGRVPTVLYTSSAFEATQGARPNQDVGMDGLNDAQESTFERYKDFINSVNTKVTNSGARDAILADVSADNYNYYLGDDLDERNASILMRYKNSFGLENNSPESTNNQYTPSNSTLPDNEDLNQDNTINFDNNYYEYEIDINPDNFDIGQNYIISKHYNAADSVEFIQFRIPIREPVDTIGSIQGFKSIRFLRMYVTGFEEPVILRFPKIQLVSNQWRVFGNSNKAVSIRGISPQNGDDGGLVNVSMVNIEENASAVQGAPSSPYVLPPGYNREQDITSTVPRQLNEKSLRLCVEDLKTGFAGSVFKNVNYDMINYKRLRMFIHAETPEDQTQLKDGDLVAYLRIGTDYTQNYYEVEVPLQFTRNLSSNDPLEVWKPGNEINIYLPGLAELKAKRNGLGQPYNLDFEGQVEGRNVIVRGNPDLSSVQVMMIGVKNTSGSTRSTHTACIWTNELRLSEFVEDAGWATTGSVNLQLADLATITATGRYTSVGFGGLDQKVSQRARVNTGEWGIQGNMGLEKFLPQKLGLRLPLYASHNSRIISPKYNPLDPDVPIRTSLDNISDPGRREAYKKLVLDQQTIRSINLTNIQKVKTRPDAKSHFWDIENLTLSIGYNETKRTNSQLKDYTNKVYNSGIGYTFNNPAKPIEPFKNFKFLNSKYLKLIKEFNFSILPTNVTFRADLNRRLTRTQYWEGNPMENIAQDPFYEKVFTFNRNYGLVWNLTKSITVNYSAVTTALIDEPEGEPNSKVYNKQLWENIKKLGRTKNYNQTFGATYKVPLDKLPFTDWLSADLNYNSTFTWTAGANQQREEFGNLLLQNTRDMGVNGRVSLDKLYNKSKFLKEINNPAPKPKTTTSRNPSQAKDTTKTEPKAELKGLKSALRVVMSARSVNFSYKVNEGTKMAGYRGTANVFGMQRGENPDYYSHMLPFTLGWQDSDIRYKLWEDSLISKSRLLNDHFIYSKTENFTASTQLEPLKDFSIKINVSRVKTTEYSELFHISPDDTLHNLLYASDAPLTTGSYNISYIALGSAFLGRSGSDPSSSEAFRRFVESRRELRGRLISNYGISPEADSLYGLNSQDILIPAFIAAYSGKKPGSVSLSPFPNIPLPNWNISYTGLNKIPALKKIFSSINITHNYTSNYSVSSFTSSLLYGPDRITPTSDPGIPTKPDVEREGVFVPQYTIDVVSIKESFSPLIGINVKTKGRASYNIQYIKDRGVILAMANAQIQETQSSGITVGFAWTKANLKLPFRWQGREIPPLKNETQFKADLTIRDNKTVQRVIDGASTVTAGNVTIQFRPTINYMVSQRLNVMFYFDRQVNIPRISSSFRRGVTSFGIQLRFSLS